MMVVNILSKLIPIIYLIAALLNIIFNNDYFGYEGNITLNIIILFAGYPIYHILCKTIRDKMSKKTAITSLVLIGINTIVFFIGGIYTIITGSLDGVVFWILYGIMLASSAYFLYILARWRWFGIK